ncbi:MAG: endonuclease III, partial [Dehalococcoidia bacterium]
MARSKIKAAPLTPSEIVERLSELYGRPQWRPHGDGMAELVLTVLSQNTSDTNSRRAFSSLVSRFPAWEALMTASPEEIETEIQMGGLAATKAPRIKAIVEEVWR